MNLKSFLTTAAGLSLIAAPAVAQVYIETGWSGGFSSNSTIAVSFTPSSDASITDVGVFQYTGYTSATVQVSVWEQGVSSPLESISIALTPATLATPQISGFNFNYVFANKDLSLSFTPVPLTAGHHYAVSVYGTAGTYRSNPNGSGTESPGVLTLSGTYNPGSVVATNPFDGGFSAYTGNLGGLNMIVGGAIAVPEPSTYAAVAGLGLVGFAALRKFRR